MESAAPFSDSAVTATSSEQHSRPSRGGPRTPRRGRGQGDRGHGDRSRGSRGGGGRQSRGRGRGDSQNTSHHRRLSSASQNIDPTKPLLSPRERSASQSGETSTTTSAGNSNITIVNPTNANTNDNAVEEEEVCFICASPVIHYSVAPCNHVTCHICSLRLRALYKTKACAHCRSNAEFVIFTDQGEKRFEDFSEAEVAKTDTTLGIKYEKNEILEDTILLLRYNCPDPSCDIACYGWPDLHKHVKNTHHRIMCDLCTRNKKVFTHEHELFTQATLRKHEKYGDDNPGSVDQSGFKGHPECGFCRQRFYGDDELYTHCRDKHERCHICDRLQTSRQQQYYLDYGQLEIHFRKDHFLCPDQECLDKKFVVFESEMDLKAHQLEVHPNGLSKDARRDARRVDMSGFDYRPAHQESRGGRREGRGRGRGRDPNAEMPLPVSSAQPLRRDELAYQRQLAIHSAQSVSTRTFGGQLSSSIDAYAARAPVTATAPATVTATPGNLARPSSSPAENTGPPSLDTLNIEDTRSLSPASRARSLRHNSVIERASNLLGNDASSMASFRNLISQYRTSAMSATQLIDSFVNLFDSTTTSSNDLGTLIKELADIFEIPSKKEELLKAWNDYRAIHEDYPSLPGPDGSSASRNAGSGGKRILKLKSSTVQANKNAIGRTGTWGLVAGSKPSIAPGQRDGMAFPPMPSSSGLRTNSIRSAWITAGTSNSATRPNQVASASSSSTLTRPAMTSAAAAPSSDAFPALPSTQKPTMNALRPGYGGNPRLQRNGTSNTSANAWGGGNLPSNDELAAAVEAAAENGDETTTSGKGRGKGKGKKVFMHWG